MLALSKFLIQNQLYYVQIISLSNLEVKILQDEPAKMMADIKAGTTVSNALIVVVVLHSHPAKPLR